MEPSTITALGKYVVQWLKGLRDASNERKQDCIAAIENVISAARRTQRYCCERDRGQQNSDTEANLSVLWTEIGNDLRRLKVYKLAKRSDLKGRYWAAEPSMPEEFWAQADIGLERMEQLARQIRAEIERHGEPQQRH